MSLSERLRPNCEAAPWVVEEVRKLEQGAEQLRSDICQQAREIAALNAQIARMRKRAGNACCSELPMCGVLNALKDIEQGCPTEADAFQRDMQAMGVKIVPLEELLNDAATTPGLKEVHVTLKGDLEKVAGTMLGDPSMIPDELKHRSPGSPLMEMDALLIAHMKKGESNLARAYIALQAEAEALRCERGIQATSLQEARAKVEKLLAGEMQRGFEGLEYGEKIILRQEVARLQKQIIDLQQEVGDKKAFQSLWEQASDQIPPLRVEIRKLNGIIAGRSTTLDKATATIAKLRDLLRRLRENHPNDEHGLGVHQMADGPSTQALWSEVDKELA